MDLSKLTPEQKQAVMQQAQQEANQQVMQAMVKTMVTSCFQKCAGTSVSFCPGKALVCLFSFHIISSHFA